MLYLLLLADHCRPLVPPAVYAGTRGAARFLADVRRRGVDCTFQRARGWEALLAGETRTSVDRVENATASELALRVLHGEITFPSAFLAECDGERAYIPGKPRPDGWLCAA